MSTGIMLAAHKVYRKRNPRSRAPAPIILAKNTAAVRQYRCVICGAHSPTCCNRFRETRRVSLWRWEHDCSREALRYIARHYNPSVAAMATIEAYNA